MVKDELLLSGVLGEGTIVVFKEFFDEVELGDGCHCNNEQLHDHEEDDCDFCVPEEDFVDVVAFDEEVLVPVQLLQFLIAPVEVLMDLHLLLVPD